MPIVDDDCVEVPFNSHDYPGFVVTIHKVALEEYLEKVPLYPHDEKASREWAQNLCIAVIKSWKGLTYKYLARLINDTEKAEKFMKQEGEYEFKAIRVVALLQNSIEFCSFIMDNYRK